MLFRSEDFFDLPQHLLDECAHTVENFTFSPSWTGTLWPSFLSLTAAERLSGLPPQDTPSPSTRYSQGPRFFIGLHMACISPKCANSDAFRSLQHFQPSPLPPSASSRLNLVDFPLISPSHPLCIGATGGTLTNFLRSDSPCLETLGSLSQPESFMTGRPFGDMQRRYSHCWRVGAVFASKRPS